MLESPETLYLFVLTQFRTQNRFQRSLELLYITKDYPAKRVIAPRSHSALGFHKRAGYIHHSGQRPHRIAQQKAMRMNMLCVG